MSEIYKTGPHLNWLLWKMPIVGISLNNWALHFHFQGEWSCTLTRRDVICSPIAVLRRTGPGKCKPGCLHKKNHINSVFCSVDNVMFFLLLTLQHAPYRTGLVIVWQIASRTQVIPPPFRLSQILSLYFPRLESVGIDVAKHLESGGPGLRLVGCKLADGALSVTFKLLTGLVWNGALQPSLFTLWAFKSRATSR